MATRYTNADDWNAGDVNTAFQDVVLSANSEVQIGRYDVPASGKVSTIGGGKIFLEIYDDTKLRNSEVRDVVLHKSGKTGNSGSTLTTQQTGTGS